MVVCYFILTWDAIVGEMASNLSHFKHANDQYNVRVLGRGGGNLTFSSLFKSV